MKFGLLYLPTYVPKLDGSFGEFFGRMLDQVAFADELGFHAAWLTEHHFDPYGGAIPNPAVFGAAIAQRTRRIRIGTAVTVLPLHNPLLVAEDFAMLDVLSNGRLDFGVGRGSLQAEFHQLGISPEDSAEVVAEATELIARAWSEPSFEHHGRHYDYGPISLLPRPVQRPHPPIWVGAARTTDSFEWAGRNGFHLMVLPYMFPPEFLQERIAVYHEALRSAGHDPATKEIMAKFHVFVGETSDEAHRLAAPAYENYQRISSARSGREHKSHWRAGSTYEQQVAEYKVIAGSPADCCARLRYWRETLPLTQIGGTFHFGGLDQTATLRSLELFAHEVAPAFTGAAARSRSAAEPQPSRAS